jgi:hypothetical protein
VGYSKTFLKKVRQFPGGNNKTALNKANQRRARFWGWIFWKCFGDMEKL